MHDLSIGVDIVSIDRIYNILNSQNGNRFKHRIFTDPEISYCQNKANSIQHFAGRFAAKEAVKKAILSSHINQNIWFKKIEIKSRQDGAPLVRLPKPIQSDYQCECSISHEGNHAIAFAIMQKK
tara:strand:+ start:28 stop:399 length:372 start_codon:yes stop_codon:yes gene_type:complete